MSQRGKRNAKENRRFRGSLRHHAAVRGIITCTARNQIVAPEFAQESSKPIRVLLRSPCMSPPISFQFPDALSLTLKLQLRRILCFDCSHSTQNLLWLPAMAGSLISFVWCLVNPLFTSSLRCLMPQPHFGGANLGPGALMRC
jgi:hypothetical protein